MEKNQNANWKKYPYLYNKNHNIDFQCSCGKLYTSYPALYLHCQRKHGKKISAQLVKEQCISAVSGQQKAYRYTLNQISITEEEKQNYATQLKNQILFIVEQYCTEVNQSEEQVGFFYKSCLNYTTKTVLEQFMSYVCEEFNSNNQTQIKEIIYCLPYYFNSFILERSRESQQINKNISYCQILQKLGLWMKEKKYTDLVTILEQKQISNQTDSSINS